MVQQHALLSVVGPAVVVVLVVCVACDVVMPHTSPCVQHYWLMMVKNNQEEAEAAHNKKNW